LKPTATIDASLRDEDSGNDLVVARR